MKLLLLILSAIFVLSACHKSKKAADENNATPPSSATDNDNTTDTETETNTNPETTVSLRFTYDVSSKWNRWLKSDGTIICDPGSAIDRNSCLHNGEQLTVEITGASSCTSLSLTDSLDAFRWSCVENAGEISFVTTSLQNGKGLIELIDRDAKTWKPISVTLSTPGGDVSTTPKLLWDNRLVFDNGDLSGGVSDDIYVFTSDIASVTKVIPNPNFTVLLHKESDNSDVVFTMGSAVDTNCNGGKCFFYSNAKDFVWIEGGILDVNAEASSGINLAVNRFSTVKNTEIINAPETAIPISATSYSQVDGVYIEGAINEGIQLTGNSSHNLVSNTEIYSGTGLVTGSISTVVGCDHNYFINIKSGNHSDNSFDISGSFNYLVNIHTTNDRVDSIVIKEEDVVLVNVTSTHHSSPGIRLFSAQSDSTLMANITVANNFSNGILYNGTAVDQHKDTTLHNINLMNNNRNGFGNADFGGASNMRIYDVSVSSSTGGGEIEVADNTDLTIHGRFQIHDNTMCVVSGTGTANFDNGDCDTADNTPDGPITSIATAIDPSSSFVGLLSPAVYGSVTNWIDPLSPYIGIGVYDTNNNDTNEASSIYNTFAIGDCEPTDECAQYDHRLKNGDTGNGSGGPVFQNVHPCPIGSEVITHTFSDVSTVTFLRYASEVVLDGIGNDNGLCESNEHCIVSYNFGHYQGEGSLVAASETAANTKDCSDIGSGGSIENVTLWKYATNGVP